MCSQSVLKAIMIAFNILFLLVGLGVGAVGLWVRVKKIEYEELLGSTLLPVIAYLMMGGGFIVAFVALVGCVGAIKRSRAVLLVYIGCLSIIFGLQAAAGLLGFIYYDEVRPLLDEHVKDALMIKYGYEDYNLVSKAIDFMQQKLECCGYLAPDDWLTSKYFHDNSTATDRGDAKVPKTCCKSMVKSNCENSVSGADIFAKGCMEAMEEWIKDNMLLVGAFGVGVACTQLVGVVLSICLCKKNEVEDEY